MEEESEEIILIYNEDKIEDALTILKYFKFRDILSNEMAELSDIYINDWQISAEFNYPTGKVTLGFNIEPKLSTKSQIEIIGTICTRLHQKNIGVVDQSILTEPMFKALYGKKKK